MSALYEMLVSQSPPVYNSYLSDYPLVQFRRENFSKYSHGTCRSASGNAFLVPSKRPSSTMSLIPRRPCLVTRLEDHVKPKSEDSSSSTRHKKKVVFADDQGMSLTHVRIMTEPSNVPPILNSRFLSEITQGLTADPVGKSDSWEITFTQPASDYLQFRQKLDCQKVSLENVIIKELEESVIGTIKVSNVSFKKEVFVRLSFDSWETHEDTFCKYVDNSSKSTLTTTLYDTFSFKFALPPKTRCIQFCICFLCEGQEFWDNNSNSNYVLVKKMYNHSFNNNILTNESTILQNKDGHQVTKCLDAVYANLESWSEFASWNHLENTSPYW